MTNGLTPAEVVDGQLGSYRARDLEAYFAWFAPGAPIVRLDGQPFAADPRAMYGQLFEASPDLAVEITQRIETGSVIVDEECITGVGVPGAPSEMHGVAIYEVDGGLITRMTIVG